MCTISRTPRRKRSPAMSTYPSVCFAVGMGALGAPDIHSPPEKRVCRFHMYDAGQLVGGRVRLKWRVSIENISTR